MVGPGFHMGFLGDLQTGTLEMGTLSFGVKRVRGLAGRLFLSEGSRVFPLP